MLGVNPFSKPGLIKFPNRSIKEPLIKYIGNLHSNFGHEASVSKIGHGQSLPNLDMRTDTNQPEQGGTTTILRRSNFAPK